VTNQQTVRPGERCFDSHRTCRFSFSKTFRPT